MYHTMKEFLDDWKFESEATKKVFSSLTDESLNHKITPKGRSLGRLAWHITVQIGELLNSIGIKFNNLNDDENFPPHIKSLIENYQSVSNILVKNLSESWTDNTLKEEIMMFGQKWTKEAALMALVKHQIHHRGQMTVLMRAAGLKVPGIYGPAYEEWQQFGMPPAV